MDNATFPSGTSHVTVRCRSCGHTDSLTQEMFPIGILEADFERAYRCLDCGTDWLHVTKFPRPVSRWGV